MTTKFRFMFIPILFILISSILLLNNTAFSAVQRVDFLGQKGLNLNGAGPLLVKMDSQRNRIILVNTNTASISVIDSKTDEVTNIPIKTRIPQYLKMEALTLDNKTGNIYIIGSHGLHVVYPDKKKSETFDTEEQYEMVTVNEKTGDAFLVGRESTCILVVQLKTGKTEKIRWTDKVEKMMNLNQTPPPSIRKIICDASLNQLIAVDGYSSELSIFSTDSNKLIKKRKLEVKGGSRWHWGGYNESTHFLYLVIETQTRVVSEAIKIDIINGKDTIISLPGFTEGVGILYNGSRDEVYIPYDNHPSVHVVDFKNNGKIEEIKIPTYGNDASVVDQEEDLLYVSCWAYGEVEVIDLKSRKLKKVIKDVGIIPHMFNMTFDPGKKRLIIPIGATAVNGSFGAALTALDPFTEKQEKIYTGWAPVELVEMKSKDGFLVFNSEDEFAEVLYDGNVTMHRIPPQCKFINNALETPSGNIYVSYGPHQSYWPVVYIWGARNGILSIDPDSMTFYDRRIPRMAQAMTLDKNGALYALQNNWGDEKQFIISLPDEYRFPNLGDQRIELEDPVSRETTQRLIKYDESKHWLYICRVGESDDLPGILQIFDIASRKTLLKYPVGLNPTDIVFDNSYIYIANFDSDSIAIIDKNDFSVKKIKTGKKPFKLAVSNGSLFSIAHNDRLLQELNKGVYYPIPCPGKPDNLADMGSKLIITAHSIDALYIIEFDKEKKVFEILHKESYPYGDVTVDTDNSSFYMRGQLGDGIFELNKIKKDRKGRIWITDYLSGKLFIF